MSWPRRFRLTLGVVMVLAVVGGLTMFLNERQGRVQSTTAAIDADSYTVGTDYAGVVTEQHVEPGDDVSAGERLFEIESPTLEHDLSIGLMDRETAAYEITEDNTIIITAAGDGVMNEVDYTAGAFVPANSVLATINRAQSRHVEAEFMLTAEQFARVEPDARAEVVLPDGGTVEAVVTEMTVADTGVESRAIATLTSSELDADTQFLRVGTPVEATLQLRNDGVVTTASETVQQAWTDATAALDDMVDAW